MSMNHKNSKRKDLAFVTYESHEEAKDALDNFNSKKPEIENVLGSNVSISLAFSPQAMQTKKKIKEGRKKPITGNVAEPFPMSNIVSVPSVPIQQNSTPNMNANATAMLAMINLLNMNKVK
jgi:RNA recognition motif-containing protein